MPCPLGWTAATGQKTSEKIGDKPDFRQIADASRAVLGMLVAAKTTMAVESQIQPTAESSIAANGTPIADREKAPRTSAAPSPLRLSVIIPARNEEAQIAAAIEQVVNAGVAEVIVVDGESTDRTRELARASGATVLTSAPGRGQQQNLGAQAASGDMLLFLHADTRLPFDFAEHIASTLRRDGASAGAFRLRIAGSGRALRLVEKMADWRSRIFQLPYGDQAIFVKAETFRRSGGFADVPLMEDFDLMRRLRRQGRVELASASVTTSARRWRKLGVWRATWTNQLCILAHLLGISCHRIARWRERFDRSF